MYSSFLFLFLKICTRGFVSAGVGWELGVILVGLEADGEVLGIHSRTRIRNLGTRPGGELRAVEGGRRLLWLEAC